MIIYCRTVLRRSALAGLLVLLVSAASWAVSAPPARALVVVPGPATRVVVSLSPAVIRANGTSTTTATATVTNSSGAGVAGEQLTVTAGLGDQVGAVTDKTDGTYTATITSTTTPGHTSVTATDTSTSPAISGSASLTQYGNAASITLELSPSSIPATGTSSSVAMAVVLDSAGDAVPGDIVQFASTDPGNTFRPRSATTNANGVASTTITSSTRTGQVTISATDTSPSPSRTAAAILTQTASSSTGVTVALTPAAIPVGGRSTSTAVATVTDSNGNGVPGDAVVFSSSDPNQKVSPATDNGNGTYSATITSSNALGTATITAADTSSHLSGRATLIQTATGSGTSLISVPANPSTNQLVTLFAAVSANPDMPAGTLTFENNGVPITGCSSASITANNPTATCQTSFTAASSPEDLTAVFTPTSVLVTGSVGLRILQVGKGVTSISLAAPSPVRAEARVTYSATVSPQFSGPLAPTGGVEFFDAGTPITACANRPLTASNGNVSAACTVSYANRGKHTITAKYLGDSNFIAAPASAPRTVTVQPAATIKTTMQWSFFFTPRYTIVLGLRLEGASAGSAVRASCKGNGCPFATSTIAISQRKSCRDRRSASCKPPVVVHLQPRFANHHLGVGARVVVEVTHPGWIGKSYSFTMRSGQGPSIQISCLAPGQARPGVGCGPGRGLGRT